MSSVSTAEKGYYTENNTRYVFLEGMACQKLDQCFISLQTQLSIPDYFGHNLDALEEVLADLDWVKEDRIKIIIAHTEHLLQNDAAKKKVFLDILRTSANERIDVIYLGTTAVL